MRQSPIVRCRSSLMPSDCAISVPPGFFLVLKSLEIVLTAVLYSRSASTSLICWSGIDSFSVPLSRPLWYQRCANPLLIIHQLQKTRYLCRWCHILVQLALSCTLPSALVLTSPALSHSSLANDSGSKTRLEGAQNTSVVGWDEQPIISTKYKHILTYKLG